MSTCLCKVYISYSVCFFSWYWFNSWVLPLSQSTIESFSYCLHKHTDISCISFHTHLILMLDVSGQVAPATQCNLAFKQMFDSSRSTRQTLDFFPWKLPLQAPIKKKERNNNIVHSQQIMWICLEHQNQWWALSLSHVDWQGNNRNFCFIQFLFCRCGSAIRRAYNCARNNVVLGHWLLSVGRSHTAVCHNLACSHNLPAWYWVCGLYWTLWHCSLLSKLCCVWSEVLLILSVHFSAVLILVAWVCSGCKGARHRIWDPEQIIVGKEYQGSQNPCGPERKFSSLRSGLVTTSG